MLHDDGSHARLSRSTEILQTLAQKEPSRVVSGHPAIPPAITSSAPLSVQVGARWAPPHQTNGTCGQRPLPAAPRLDSACIVAVSRLILRISMCCAGRQEIGERRGRIWPSGQSAPPCPSARHAKARSVKKKGTCHCQRLPSLDIPLRTLGS
jgi:hypothetical protein